MHDEEPLGLCERVIRYATRVDPPELCDRPAEEVIGGEALCRTCAQLLHGDAA